MEMHIFHHDVVFEYHHDVVLVVGDMIDVISTLTPDPPPGAHQFELSMVLYADALSARQAFHLQMTSSSKSISALLGVTSGGVVGGLTGLVMHRCTKFTSLIRDPATVVVERMTGRVITTRVKDGTIFGSVKKSEICDRLIGLSDRITKPLDEICMMLADLHERRLYNGRAYEGAIITVCPLGASSGGLTRFTAATSVIQGIRLDLIAVMDFVTVDLSNRCPDIISSGMGFPRFSQAIRDALNEPATLSLERVRLLSFLVLNHPFLKSGRVKPNFIMGLYALSKKHLSTYPRFSWKHAFTSAGVDWKKRLSQIDIGTFTDFFNCYKYDKNDHTKYILPENSIVLDYVRNLIDHERRKFAHELTTLVAFYFQGIYNDMWYDIAQMELSGSRYQCGNVTGSAKLFLRNHIETTTFH